MIKTDKGFENLRESSFCLLFVSVLSSLHDRCYYPS